jgi:hypothetical protein
MHRQGGLFLSDFLTRALYGFFLSFLHAVCLTYLTQLNLIVWTGLANSDPQEGHNLEGLTWGPHMYIYQKVGMVELTWMPLFTSNICFHCLILNQSCIFAQFVKNTLRGVVYIHFILRLPLSSFSSDQWGHLLCRPIIFCLHNCAVETVQVTKGCKYVLWGPHIGKFWCRYFSFYNFPFLPLSWVGMVSSASCSQTPLW